MKKHYLTKWNKVIDKSLILWDRNPDLLDDEDLVPPSKSIIQLSCRIAQSMRDNGHPVPIRIIPNGEGGIVFEWQSGNKFESLSVESNEMVSLDVFVNRRLVSRKPIFEFQTSFR